MHPKEPQRGQILVIAVLSMFVIFAAVGLVVDGGIAYAHQRMAQNGADAAATAGGVALGQWLPLQSGSLQDPEVLGAVQGSADANGLEDWTAIYTDSRGDPLDPVVIVGQAAGGTIPLEARGVSVTGSRAGETTFARIISINQITATADATAVVGKLAGCPADSPCGLLPVTFPVGISSCQEPHETWFPPSNPFPQQTGNTWPLVPLNQAVSPSGDSLMATIALCTNQESGAVGWLDLTANTNIAEEISTPYTGEIDVPDWLHTQQGNMNNVQSALSAYIGKVVLIPMWDDICFSYPGSPTAGCNDDRAPTGDNTWYHIPQFTAFKLYGAYIQGNNSGASGPCTESPGTPPVPSGTSGFVGCIKGWFTQFLTEGPINFDADPAPGDSIGVQLIK